MNDEPRRPATIFQGADGIAERLAAERLVVVQREITRSLALVLDREVDCRLQELRVDARLCRRPSLPCGIWIVGGRFLLGPSELDETPRPVRGNQKSKQSKAASRHGVPLR